MGETESTRYAWVRELDTQSEDAEVKLVAFLGDPSWRVRQEAVNAIGKYGVTQSLVERLIQAMASGHSAGSGISSCASSSSSAGFASPSLVSTANQSAKSSETRTLATRPSRWNAQFVTRKGM